MTDELRYCLRCDTPFDPSWSGTPETEEYCDEKCSLLDEIERGNHKVWELDDIFVVVIRK